MRCGAVCTVSAVEDTPYENRGIPLPYWRRTKPIWMKKIVFFSFMYHPGWSPAVSCSLPKMYATTGVHLVFPEGLRLKLTR